VNENPLQSHHDVIEFFEREYRRYQRYWYPDLSEEERYSIVLEHSQNWAELLKQIKGLKPGKALDLGAGEGTDAIKLALLGYEVDAVEGTAFGTEKIESFSRQVGVKVNAIRMDVHDFESRKTYDVVICNGLLHYINDKNCILEKIWRATRPGGFCLLSLWSDYTPVPQVHRIVPVYPDTEKGAVWSFFSSDRWKVLYHENQRGRLDHSHPGLADHKHSFIKFVAQKTGFMD